MDIALIIVGLVGVAILLLWIYGSLNDPKQIDEDMKVEAEQQTPEAREHTRLEQAKHDAERNAQDIEFYSPGDGYGEDSGE